MVKRKKNYVQVCVWAGTIVEPEQVKEFEKMFKDDMGVRVQYLETIETAPDLTKDGFPVEGTGGRQDVFFAVHSDDVMKFSVPRLTMGIRWIEDVLAEGNYRQKIYPERVEEYTTWEAA